MRKSEERVEEGEVRFIVLRLSVAPLFIYTGLEKKKRKKNPHAYL